MPVSAQPPTVSYDGNGSTETPYAIPFKFLDASHVTLLIDGVESADGFTLSGVGQDAGGSATTSAAYTSEQRVTFNRVVPLSQDYQYNDGDRRPASTVINQHDLRVMQIQQLNEALDRTPKTLPGDTAPGGSLVQAADTTLGQDENGDWVNRTAAEEVTHLGIGDEVAAAAASAAAAADSATSAETQSGLANSEAVSAAASAAAAEASNVQASGTLLDLANRSFPQVLIGPTVPFSNITGDVVLSFPGGGVITVKNSTRADNGGDYSEVNAISGVGSTAALLMVNIVDILNGNVKDFTSSTDYGITQNTTVSNYAPIPEWRADHPEYLGVGSSTESLAILTYYGSLPETLTLPSPFQVVGSGTLTPVGDLPFLRGKRVDVVAYGDGVTDDTAAIQSAFDELESGTVDHLHFPKGVYRLNTLTANSQTSTASNVFLTMGTTAGLDGRDILITADPGAVLYSTSSPTRAHFILANARFRSLTIEGLRFEKDSVPLGATGSGEPNGCDALALVRYDRREIEHVTFRNCVFFNCHGPCRNYLPYGNNVRGLVKTFNFLNNEVLNPYGSNTDGMAWGGGQGLNVGPWIETCRVIGNRFQGVDDVVDPATNPGTGDVTWPGGIPKDAAFFGQPMRLVFQNNKVENFGIETVFQLPDENLLGFREAASLTVPPDDDTTTISWQMKDTADSTFTSGMVVTLANTASGVGDVQLVVTAWDEGTRTVTAKNSGSANNPAPGSSLTGETRVFHDVPNTQQAVITDNIFTHSQAAGLRGLTTQGMAIVISCQSVVANNTINGYATAIRAYHPAVVFEDAAASDSVISGNTIELIDRDIYTGSTSTTNNAIYLETGNQLVEGNVITTKKGLRQQGIRILADNNIIRNNKVISFEAQSNAGADRGSAISEGNGQTGNVIGGNYSSGWDAGVAVSGFSGTGEAVIESHISRGDAVAFFNMSNAPGKGDLIGVNADGSLGPISGESLVVRVESDEDRDETTTFADSAELLADLDPNTIYSVEMWFNYNTFNASAYGIRGRFEVPTGATMRGDWSASTLGSAAVTRKMFFNTGTTTVTMATNAGDTDDAIFYVTASLKVGSTGGQLKFQWAQNTLGVAGRPTTIKSGGFLKLVRQGPNAE